MKAVIVTERRPRRRNVHSLELVGPMRLELDGEVMSGVRSKRDVLRIASVLSRAGIIDEVTTVVR